VVSTPLKNMLLSWDDYSQCNIWENKNVPNHQPVLPLMIPIHTDGVHPALLAAMGSSLGFKVPQKSWTTTGQGSSRFTSLEKFDPTLWLFNIAVENCPFIEDFPIKTSIYKGFSMAMSNNQRVPVTDKTRQNTMFFYRCSHSWPWSNSPFLDMFFPHLPGEGC